jgi:hypothetical protein
MKNTDSNSNFIPINRKLFDHEFWDEKRSFSKFEAWMDLLQSARYEKENKSECIGGKQIIYGRGQLPSSIRFLKKRWNWGSITKVERYLKLLQNKDMVVLEKGQGQFVITICKYDFYNPTKNTERTVKGQQQGQQKDKSNKERNKEEYNNGGFDAFWDLYDKKVGEKTKIENKWKALKENEQELIIEYIPKYKLSQPNKKYRKDPDTFLNNKSWLDELVGLEKSEEELNRENYLRAMHSPSSN